MVQIAAAAHGCVEAVGLGHRGGAVAEDLEEHDSAQARTQARLLTRGPVRRPQVEAHPVATFHRGHQQMDRRQAMMVRRAGIQHSELPTKETQYPAWESAPSPSAPVLSGPGKCSRVRGVSRVSSP